MHNVHKGENEGKKYCVIPYNIVLPTLVKKRKYSKMIMIKQTLYLQCIIL